MWRLEAAIGRRRCRPIGAWRGLRGFRAGTAYWQTCEGSLPPRLAGTKDCENPSRRQTRRPTAPSQSQPNPLPAHPTHTKHPSFGSQYSEANTRHTKRVRFPARPAGRPISVAGRKAPPAHLRHVGHGECHAPAARPSTARTRPAIGGPGQSMLWPIMVQ